MCGPNVCGAGQYCCNASCGLCASMGGGCLTVQCPDGGILPDASACLAIPQQDSQCSAPTPHYFRCILTDLPPPCVVRSIGDVTNTYCCP